MNPLIRFTLIRRKIQMLIINGIISLLSGGGLFYLSAHLNFGGGRFLIATIAFVLVWIAIFALIAFYKLRQERFTAMYISDEGINDISTGNNIGTILWKDVESIKVMKELGSGPKERQYVVLKVTNPTDYIQREPNRAKRRTLELKLQYYGSPICFSNRALNCTFEELTNAVLFKYNMYKKMHSVQATEFLVEEEDI